MITLNDLYKGLKENMLVQELQEQEAPILDKEEIDEFVKAADKINADNLCKNRIKEIQGYLKDKEVQGELEFTQQVLRKTLDLMCWIDKEREGGRQFSYFLPGLIVKLLHDVENYTYILKQMERT